MKQVTVIGIDLAKRSFQLHGARADGAVVFRKKLSSEKVDFLASQPRCTVAMEACASSHYWGREIVQLGHEVKLVPPIYVKRQYGHLQERPSDENQREGKQSRGTRKALLDHHRAGIRPVRGHGP